MSAPLLMLALALGATPDGRAVAERADGNYRGFVGQRAEVRLEVSEPGRVGEPHVYRLTQLWKEGAPDGAGTRMLIRFTAPANLAGTALLVHEHASAEDEAWMFLAGTGQLKRLGAQEKANSLLGSEVTFEDLAPARASDFVHARLGESEVAGRKCVLVERRPRTEPASHGRAVACYDLEHGLPLSMTHHDRGGRPLRELAYEDYKPVGRWLRPHKVTIRNVQSGGKTVYIAESFRTGLELSAQVFEPAHLGRP
jgi:hypothetical protein